MKKLYAKISYNDNGSYIEKLENLIPMLDGEFSGIEEFAELDDKWVIEIVEMEEKDFNNLEEFQGW
jgi:hypothetical protein